MGVPKKKQTVTPAVCRLGHNVQTYFFLVLGAELQGMLLLGRNFFSNQSEIPPENLRSFRFPGLQNKLGQKNYTGTHVQLAGNKNGTPT